MTRAYVDGLLRRYLVYRPIFSVKVEEVTAMQLRERLVLLRHTIQLLSGTRVIAAAIAAKTSEFAT